MRVCFCVWYAKCAKYLAFGSFERADDSIKFSSGPHLAHLGYGTVHLELV